MNDIQLSGPETMLKAPEPVLQVMPSQAAGLVPLDTAQKTQLDQRVDAYINKIVSMQSSSPDFTSELERLANLGQTEIAAASSGSNRFLDKPIRQIEGGVGTDLLKLRNLVEDLDPNRKGNLLEPRKLLGIIPFGNKVTAYFDGYKSAQSHISGVLRALNSGKDELMQDNAAIDGERRRQWESMQKLEQMVHISKKMDERLEATAMQLETGDPAKAKAIKETALFYVRQRTQDMLTQMAVTIQGYLALDMVKKNNIELIKGVDRACTTTISALRTAVTVAQALTSQKLVLEQISALNTTTANLIEGTSRMMADNTARIHEQATSPAIQVEVLQRAFQNIYATMDAIDTYKVKALESMKTTVNSLDAEIGKSRDYIARSQGGQSGSEQPSLLTSV